MPTHKDIIGNEIKEDMVVVYPDRMELKIGKAVKVVKSRKMIDIKCLEGNAFSARRYAKDVIHIDHPAITMRLLSNEK